MSNKLMAILMIAGCLLSISATDNDITVALFLIPFAIFSMFVPDEE